MTEAQQTDSLVLWFEQICREDVAVVGGKSASLGEMTARTGVPVPYGFATTAHAYRLFLASTGLDKKIALILQELTDVEDSRQLRAVSAKVRQAIVDEKLPVEFETAIRSAYAALAEKTGESDPFVAVRSSATARRRATPPPRRGTVSRLPSARPVQLPHLPPEGTADPRCHPPARGFRPHPARLPGSRRASLP